ncbi:MAG: DUF1330 domain-containing protein [Caldilineaceae bacterium]|nr:DUF1330 domain-containing protein [Caldilineaceae bacterium]
MALYISTWDSSPVEEAVRQRWARTSRAAPGTVSWRVLHNPLQTTPQTMVLHEFESLEAAQQWLASPERAAMTAEARQLGRTSISQQVWNTIPAQPGPLQP